MTHMITKSTFLVSLHRHERATWTLLISQTLFFTDGVRIKASIEHGTHFQPL